MTTTLITPTPIFITTWADTGAPVTAADLPTIEDATWATGSPIADFALTTIGDIIAIDEDGSYAYPPAGIFKMQWFP